jgi:RHS repeat-associated protein/CSLREA domain-containing protein
MFISRATLLDEKGNLLATASLIVPFHKHFQLTSRDSEITTLNGELTVKFNESLSGTYTDGMTIEIGTPSDIRALETSLSGKPFQIRAWREGTETEIKQFDKPVEFEISLTNFGYSGVKTNEVFLYWYNPETEDWHGMASWVDEETNTLHSATDHFSIFDVGSNNWEASKLPSINAFQVANFTGAGTYSLPIEVPPGPGGLQPGLNLTYNSQIVDEATADTQASWVGMGWSLDPGSIVVNTHNQSGGGHHSWSLNMNGISAEIIRTAPGEYHVANENFTKINYNISTAVWTIWDTQGNVYHFEHITSLTYQTGTCGLLETLPYKWSLTRVKNIYGHQLTYTYVKETKNIRYRLMREDGWCSGNYATYPTDTASYPLTITYPGERIRIRFVRQERYDYPLGRLQDDIHHSFERSRLREIIIEGDTDLNGTFETIMRSYLLTYDTGSQVWPNVAFSAGGKTNTLVSVQQFGVGGSNASPSNALPPTNFIYADNMHLTGIDNGYGGTVTLDYEAWYFPSNARPSYYSHLDRWDNPLRLQQGMQILARGEVYFPLRPGRAYYISADTTRSVQLCLFDGYNCQYTAMNTTPQAIFILPANAKEATPYLFNPHDYVEEKNHLRYGNLWGLTTIYRVKTKTIRDGNGHSYSYTYNYSGAAVNDDIHSLGSQQNTSYTEKYSEFRGHASVTETTPDGTQTVTYFYQNDWYRGVAHGIQTSAGGKKTTETLSTYSYVQLQGHYNSGKIIPRYWVKLDAQETRIYNNDGGTYSTVRSLYTYDPSFGNLLTQADEEWNGNAWMTYRRQVHYYWPNNSSTHYLVSLPGKTEIFDAANNRLAITIYLYDGNTGDHQTMPVNGKLTATRTLARNGNQYSQISYTYDMWGNRSGMTTRSGYGAWNSSPIGDAQTTTTALDPVYHAHPISITNTLNQTYTMTYDYARGVPISETDPNGNMVAAEYDAFGRLTKLIRPGDDANSPSIAIFYQDAFPFTTTLIQKVDGGNFYTVQRVYDGMGRQTRIHSGGSIVDTVYQNPTITKQSMPYFQGETVHYTTTVINPGLRTMTVSGPDGTSTTTAVNGLTATATDANGNAITTIKDVWGRVVQVTPPTGPGTAYTYDEMDRLLTILRGGATTSIRYDDAGRKISMSDPDMGQWSYEYDALGNLIKQTDTRGQAICLYYDILNRLTGKIYSPNEGCGTPLNFDVDYNYDEGTNGIGRRTSMYDASGSTSWMYDARGRLVTEQKTISGQSFITSWTYNSADLPVTMAYPDGEVLTYEYNNRMMLERLTSSLGGVAYVDSTQYDAAGRINSRALGNPAAGSGQSELTQSYEYYSWNESAAMDSQQVGQGGRLKTMSAGSFQNLGYVYDAAGNIRAILDTVTNEIQSFEYDTLHRLTSAAATNGPAPYAEAYAYDAATGNLAMKNGIAYTYGDSAHAHAVTSLSNGNSYQYDANGNQTMRNINGQIFTLSYDAENRLVSVTSSGAPPITPTPTVVPSGTNTPTATPTPDLIPSLSPAAPSATSPTGEGSSTPAASATLTQTPSSTSTPTFTPAPGSATSTPAPTFSPSPTSASGSTFVVSKTADTNDGSCDSDCSLREAVRAANASPGRDAILLPPGIYTLIIAGADATAGKGDLDITEAVDIIGQGNPTDTLVIAAVDLNDRVFDIYAGPVSISNIGIMGGSRSNSSGGGISSENSDLALNRVIIEGNQALNGGGIHTLAGSLVIRDSAIINNAANYGGGLLTDNASVTMINVTVSGNSSVDSGGGLRIKNGGNLDLIHVTVSNNLADSNADETGAGGGIYRSAGTVTLKNSIVAGNFDHSPTANQPDCHGAILSLGYNLISNTSGCSITANSGDLFGTAGSPVDPQLGTLQDNGGNTPTHALQSGSPAINSADNASCTSTDQRGYPRDPSCDMGAYEFDGSALLPGSRMVLAAYRSAASLQNGSLTFTPTDDAYIASGSPTTNYGSATTLQTDASPVKDFLLKFSVTGVNGQTVTNAKIRLYNVDASTKGGDFYRAADNDWTESTVTWNNAPASEGSLIASLGSVSVNTWYEVDVTSLVTGDGAYSLRVSSTSTNGADYSSKEGANPPQLVITLGDTPAPSPTTMATPTLTPDTGIPGAPSPTPAETATPTLPSTPTVTLTPPPPIFSNASFTYDGDGKRVKSVMTTTISTTATYFVGAHYEVTNGVVTKYYYAGSQRIAMRTNGSLFYLLGDHLGSTNLVTDANGMVISELRYKAWGETRYASGVTPTQYQYTGQFSYEVEFGLYYYNARWYDGALGRFAQADTIVPPGVQGWDRFAAMNNNPIRYIDPSGHVACSVVAEEDCSFENKSWEQMYGITISRSFKQHERLAILKAVSAVGSAFAQVLGGEAGNLFQQVYGEINFERCSDCTGLGRTSSRDGGRSHTIYIKEVYSTRDALNRSTRLVVHELGHAFNNVVGGQPASDIPSALLRPLSVSGYEEIGGIQYPVYGINHGTGDNDFFGYQDDMNYWQFGFTSTLPVNEEFADMFVGWTYNTWGRGSADTSSLAYQRMQHMATFMPGYLLGR